MTIVTAVVLASHIPLVACHFCNLWQKDHYQFFPLLLAGTGWVLWTRWQSSSLGGSQRELHLAPLLLGFVVLCAAVLLFSPWLAAVAAILTVGGVLYGLAGGDRWREWLPAWALLWLLVPAPLGRDKDLILRLQSVASRASSATLDILGVRHLVEGHVLELPGQRLFVEEACSGVNSLFVLLAATALFIVATRRPVMWTGLLLASSVFWAGSANVGRVVTVAVAQSWWNIDLTSGFGHEVLGITVVGIALLLLASTDRLLAFLLGQIDLRARYDVDYDEEEEVAVNPLSNAWNRFVGDDGLVLAAVGSDAILDNPKPQRGDALLPRLRFGLLDRTDEKQDDDIYPPHADSGTDAAARGPAVHARGGRTLHLIVVGFVLLAVLQVVGLVSSGARPFVDHRDWFLRSGLFDGFGLPAALDGWAQVEVAIRERDSGNSSGVHSTAWYYRSGSCICRIAVDYPFSHWHDLSDCYAAQGWTIDDRTVHRSDLDSGVEHDPYVEVQMTGPGDQHGLLLFSMVDQEGRAPPCDQTVYGKCMKRIDENPLRCLLAGHVVPLVDSTFQVQTLCSSSESLSASQRQAVRRLFFQARRQIVSAYRVRRQRSSDG